MKPSTRQLSPFCVELQDLPSPAIIALLTRHIRRLTRCRGYRRGIATAIQLDAGQFATLLAT